MKYKSIYKKMKKEIYNVEIVFLNLITFLAYVAPSGNDYSHVKFHVMQFINAPFPSIVCGGYARRC